ncbi:hypothetical protein LIA77_07580 [Sarocladium implicatum]|nr:hypothetical protein LIA77_07580 [Sarocladium implicatum]
MSRVDQDATDKREAMTIFTWRDTRRGCQVGSWRPGVDWGKGCGGAGCVADVLWLVHVATAHEASHVALKFEERLQSLLWGHKKILDRVRRLKAAGHFLRKHAQRLRTSYAAPKGRIVSQLESTKASLKEVARMTHVFFHKPFLAMTR